MRAADADDTMRDMDDVIRSTARGRRTILARLTLLTLVVVGSAVWLRPLLEAPMPPDLPREQAVRQGLGMLRLFGAFVVVTCVTGGAYGVWLARQLLRHRQFPLPGTLVLHDTPVRRGTRVRWRAYVLVVLSSMMFALAAFAVERVGSLARAVQP